jgi:sulfite exporter TauE/SafE
MIIFGIATTVPLVLYGIFGQSLINRLQNKVKQIKLIVLTLSSIWLIYMGVNMLMMMDMAQTVHKCH